MHVHAQSSQTKYSVSANTTTTQTTDLVPANCYYVLIECIGGGGGGGGSRRTSYGGSGGGGGAYSAALVAVTPGSTLYIQTGGGGTSGYDANGGNGGDSWVKTVSQSGAELCLAKGGLGGQRRQGTRGAGGSASSGFGDIKYSGGGGAKGGGNGNAGGGGGNAAGLGGAGGDNSVHQYPTHQTNGAYTHPPGPGNPHGGKGWGGAGGDGGGTNNGYDGNWYGGGGGGGFSCQTVVVCGNSSGGVGAQGIVIITYYTSTTKPSLPASAITGSTNTLCAGGQLQLTVNLPSIVNGTKAAEGTDTVYRFTGNGWFSSPGNITSQATMLVVGGGGGGGRNGGGGGGAGEYVALSNQTINAGVYQVGVGDGGAAATSNTVTASNGHISIFGTSIKANGGGGGASRDGGGYPLDGGSGGAGSGAAGNGWRELYGAASVKLNNGAGYAGANGYGDAGCYSAGGGGGGSAGGGGGSSSNKGGNGAGGTANSITGISIKYAAGGGGGVTCTNSGYTNGLAGDNTGGAPGTNPTANSGSGGGGATAGSPAATAGAVGVVIIRLPAGAWSSSNTNVATVSNTGLVTASSTNSGTATISYTIGGQTYGTYDITVNPTSVGGTAGPTVQNLCGSGIPVNITLSGHTGSIQWQSSPDNSTWTDMSGKTTSPLSPGALSVTTYFRAKVTSGVCTEDYSNVVVVYTNDVDASGVLATTSSSRTCNVSGTAWHYFRNNAGEVIAAINSNGENLGNVTMAVTVETIPHDVSYLSPEHGNGGLGREGTCFGMPELSMRRWYTITPSNQPAAGKPSTILLFFTGADYSNYTTEIGTWDALYSSSYPICYGYTLSATDLAVSKDETNDMPISPAPSAIGPNGSYQYQLSIPSFSTFRFHTNGGIGEPLPVELISFTGYHNNARNTLVWKTASESNTDRFEIEKSIDGANWQYIGMQQAVGNTTGHSDYTFYDNAPASGNNYYRLKIVDNDATYEYSNVINIKIEESNMNGIVSIYPNPTDDEVSIVIQTPQAQQTNIAITNLMGQVVMNVPISLLSGTNKLQIQTASLASGTYFISYTDNKAKRHNEKLIKK